MNQQDDFKKYATKHLGISSMTLHQFTSQYNSYISPTIIEERQLNVASMDVFSRLMMDRIIFLGAPIDDYVANIIQAQLLYLDSADPNKDIQVYFNYSWRRCSCRVWVFMIPCNILPAMWPPSVQAWLHPWVQYLLAAGTAGKRSALKHSRVMIHQPMGGAQGQASDIEITTREILKMKKELYAIIAEHSGKSFEAG